MSTIFISYRRDDTAPYAGRICDRLTSHFGAGRVFMDIDHIEPGEDFVDVIQRKVSACETAIVLIGRNWLGSQDADGRRRLDDPEDFVRLEVAAALARKVRVVPVLVGGAAMPRARDLPEAIAALARRNAIEISDARFHGDCDRLIEALAKSPTATAAPPGDVKEAATQTPGAQAGAAPAHARITAGRGKGWAIAAAATLGVAVLAFVGLRGTNTASPPSSVEKALPVLESRSAKASDDTIGAASPEASTSLVTAPRRDPSGFARNSSVDQFMREVSRKEILELTERAMAGNAEAQFELGVLHELGTPKNLVEAAKWYSRAAQQRYALAREGVDDVQTLLLRGTTRPDPKNKADTDIAMRQFERMRASIDAYNTRAKREIQRQ